MVINGINIDPAKLLSKEEVLSHLKMNYATDKELAEILDRHDVEFGNTLMWRYPISDSVHAGGAIVAVKEGFLYLPYDSVDEVDYEIYILNDAALLDEDALRYFIDDWKLYSDDLLATMTDMLRIVQDKNN